MDHAKSIILYRGNPSPCPYLEGKTWTTHLFVARKFPSVLYESLLSEGFRRSGYIFYQNHCENCTSCIPLRIPVSKFQPSVSMRKCLRRNRDVEIVETSISFDVEVFALYRRYNIYKHEKEEPSIQEEGFRRFLCASPIDTRMLRYFVHGKLVGVSWIDYLPHSLSSVYFAFEPEEAKRSLGTFSVLKELEIAKNLGKDFYYLGFYVPNSPKMSYKARFKPYELLINGQWQTPTFEQMGCHISKDAVH
ncbi:MAG: arginyltransferase [Spirochaetes bacterium]|nr:arginyltransferase [Spirochaetota bacterium]